jgi:hypothetical protein
MTLTRKDAAATFLTGLVVLAFVATHEAWNVPLIGDSHRWAAVVIFLLGAVTCGLGSRTQGMPLLFSALGTAALVMAVASVATGSLTALWLLVVAIVALWAAATFRHARHARHSPAKPIAT